MRYLGVFALVLAVCLQASAEMPKLSPPDPRLDKKVTLEVNHTKLEDVTKSLVDQSGVTIKAGSSTRDWKVRERRVTIQAKDVTLGSALDEISRVVGFYVSREGKEGEWTYTIWQDKKSRDLEKEMLTAEKEAAAQRVKQMRQSAIDGAKKALGMAPDEAMKLKDKDPMTAFMGGTKSGRAFAQLLTSMGSQFPTEYDLMMRGKRATLPTSGLPAGMQESLNQALDGAFSKAIMREGQKNPPKLDPYQITFLPMDGMGNQTAELMGVGGMMFITSLGPDGKPNNNPLGGQPMIMFPLIAPDSKAAGLFGDAMLGLEAGETLQQVGERMGPKMEDPSFLADSLAKDSPTEKDLPTDPELTREVEIKADAMPSVKNAAVAMSVDDRESQGKALAEISRALSWPVYFESFARTMPIGMFVKAGKQPVYRVLIGLEKAGYKWEHGDGTLRIRPSDWATKRSYEIPESYIAFYKDLLEKQGEFTLDDVAGIASSLTDEQIQNTLVFDPDLGFLMATLAGEPFGGSRHILRLYASLGQDQKQAIYTEAGVPFDQLSNPQWDMMNEIITGQLGGVYVADGNIRIKPLTGAGTKDNSPCRTFEVTVHVQNGQDPRAFSQIISLMSKSDLTARKEAMKKAEEARKAAEQQKPAQPAPTE